MAKFLQSQSPRIISAFGMAQGVVTSTTRANLQVALALYHHVQSQFHMDITEVDTIRLRRGVSSYPKMNASPQSCVIFWNSENSENMQVLDLNCSRINMKERTEGFKTASIC